MTWLAQGHVHIEQLARNSNPGSPGEVGAGTLSDPQPLGRAGQWGIPAAGLVSAPAPTWESMGLCQSRWP